MATPTPTSPHAAATFALPNGWDVERDVIVLYGDNPGSAVGELLRGGQRRVIAYLPEGAGAVDMPIAGIAVRSRAELMRAFLEFPDEGPELAVVQVLAGNVISDGVRESIVETVRHATLSRRINRNTIDTAGETWALQGLTNLARIAESVPVDRLADAFAGKPAVIISPGPSLSKNIGQLAALKDRALLITCTHAMPALRAAGVVPDLVLATDPKDLSWQFDGEDVEATRGIVATPTVHPNVFDLPAPRAFTFASCPEIDQWIYEGLAAGSSLDTAGSVSGNAVSLALKMGCDPLILVGQDLAFDGDRYYADGLPDGESKVEIVADGKGFVLGRLRPDRQTVVETPPQPILDVPGVLGGMVTTTVGFDQLRTWLSMVAEAQGDDVRMFNCTEGGAFIEQMQHRPLAEVVRECIGEPFDVEGCLDEAVQGWDVEHARSVLLAKANELQAALTICDAAARKCSKLAKKAIGRPEILAKLDAAERDLSGMLKRARFVSLIATEEIRETKLVGQAATTLKENLAAARRLFRVVEVTCRKVAVPLSASITRLGGASGRDAA